MPALLKLFLLPGKILANILYLFPTNHMEAVQSARHKDNPMMHAFYTCGLVLIGGLIFLNWKPHVRVQPRQTNAIVSPPLTSTTSPTKSEASSHSDTGNSKTGFDTPDENLQIDSNPPSEIKTKESPKSLEIYFEETLFQNALGSNDSGALNKSWGGIAIINQYRSDDPCRTIEFGFDRVLGDRPWEQRFCPSDDGLWLSEGQPYQREIK